MRRKFLAASALIVLAVMATMPVEAITRLYKQHFHITKTVLVDGVVTLGSKPVLSTGTVSANGDTLTIPDLGNAAFVLTAGTQTIAGAKTFSTAPTITGGLTAANIQTGSAKRQLVTVRLSPETGAASNTTVYRGTIYFGRAGVLKKLTYGTGVDPTSGTNVLAFEKGSYSGTTVLSTATVSLNGATANTAVTATLSATPSDLAFTATEPLCCEYNAGTQGSPAEQVTATAEFEPTDF